MRLTLRTMLAYLDDVLEPADAEELGKKIADSEFATQVVQKIRTAVSHPRLGAPKVDGKGLAADANSVAEYLDNILAPDRIPDFERHCLESDVHLAEAAGCHQVLTLVLGRPAEVSQALRERAYQILQHRPAISLPPAEKPEAKPAPAPSSPAAAGTAAAPAQPGAKWPPIAGGAAAGAPAASAGGASPAGSAAAAAAAAAPPPAEPKAKPEVPDILRETRRRPVWPLLLTMAAAFVLALLGLRVLGPFDARHPLLGGLFPAPTEIAAGPETPEEVDPTPSADAPAADADADSGTDAGDIAPPTAGDGPAPADGVPTDAGGEPAAPVEPSEPGPAPALPPEPAPAVPGDGGDPAEPMLLPDPGATPLPMPPDPDPGAAMVHVGRLVSDHEVLAAYDERTTSWTRLPNHAPITSGMSVFAPPAYRPQITLANGVNLTLVGPARVEFVSLPKAPGIALRLEYGRALLLAPPAEGAGVRLEILGRADPAAVEQGPLPRMGDIAFLSFDAACAVEVQRLLQPGSNPAQTTDPSTGAWTRERLAWIAATTGDCSWTEGAEAQTIRAGEFLTLADEQAPQLQTFEQPPPWIEASAISDPLRLASEALQPALEPGQPLYRLLQEKTTERRAEVRALAVLTLSYLGHFDAILESFIDAEQRAFWDDQFSALRDALGRGPEPAGQVRLALEKLRGADAAALYQLLWGFSNRQLQAEATGQMLVDYLDHPALDFRVLAYLNLYRITGVTYLYRPEVNESRRRTPVQRWREKLKDGLLPKGAPASGPPPAAPSASSDVSDRPFDDPVPNVLEPPPGP